MSTGDVEKRLSVSEMSTRVEPLTIQLAAEVLLDLGRRDRATRLGHDRSYCLPSSFRATASASWMAST